MTNYFSPASDYYPLAVASAAVVASVVAPPRVRYPSPPPGLRALRVGLNALYAVWPALAVRAVWRLFSTPRRPVVRPWEADALADAWAFRVPFDYARPATGQSGQSGHPGLMAYAWGDPAAPAVVLVHGWDHRAAFWATMARGLVAAGYRVVAFDGPAHGASAGATAARRTHLLEYHAAVQAVLAAVAAQGPASAGVRAVVAHSFGAAAIGALPLTGVAALPRLVLMSAPATLRAVAERFARLLHLPPTVVEGLSAHIARLFGATFGTYDLATNGPVLRVERVLLLHDTADEVVPFADASTIAAAWPALTLAPTTGLGHNAIMRDAGVIGRVAAFLG